MGRCGKWIKEDVTKKNKGKCEGKGDDEEKKYENVEFGTGDKDIWKSGQTGHAEEQKGKIKVEMAREKNENVEKRKKEHTKFEW